MEAGGDGHSDILWRSATGDVARWLINGGAVIATSFLGYVATSNLGNVATNWVTQVGASP
jgi:hypothetical protein